MRKRIDAYTLSVEALDALIKDLKAYIEDFKDKEQEFLGKLAEKAKTALEEAYAGKKITVTYEHFQEGSIHGVDVIANGDKIGFIEFGAGVYSGEGSEFKDNAPFDVYPGSWSKDHAQRWQEWIADGKDPYKFPYNKQPVNAFPKAYAVLRTSAYHLAQEVFGGRH